MIHPGKLIHAADLIVAAIVNAHTEAHECPNCGLNKAENYAEKKAFEELSAMAEKLKRYASRLSGTAGVEIRVEPERRKARAPVEFEPEFEDGDFDEDAEEHPFAPNTKSRDVDGPSHALETYETRKMRANRARLRAERQALHNHGAGGCQAELAENSIECVNPQCGWRYRLP